MGSFLVLSMQYDRLYTEFEKHGYVPPLSKEDNVTGAIVSANGLEDHHCTEGTGPTPTFVASLRYEIRNGKHGRA